MSDKRRRRIQNSDDSEGSEGEDEVKVDKVGGDDLDTEKDEGVVRKNFVLFNQPSSSSPNGSHLDKFHHRHSLKRPCVQHDKPFLQSGTNLRYNCITIPDPLCDIKIKFLIHEVVPSQPPGPVSFCNLHILCIANSDRH